jgi:hypothetical protein
MQDTHTFTAPLDGADGGSLELTRGGERLALLAGEVDGLCRASFRGAPPSTSAEGGRVAIRYPRVSLDGLLRPGARSAEIVLGTAVPWTIAVAGGLGRSTLELSELELRGLEVAGGASGVLVVLPRPRGVVPVRLAGGASRVELLRPAGTAATLRLEGGASRLAFDGVRYGSIGGATRLETPAAATERDRYELEILGGASRLTVAEYAGAEHTGAEHAGGERP